MIPDVYLLQASKKNLKLAKELQNEMSSHFFENTLFDVKDSLTSILALCDMEDMKQTGKVKMYIRKISDMLNDVRLYHNSECFNVTHVLQNIISTIQSKYKGLVKLDQSITPIKALAKADQQHLEQVLLFLLIEAIEANPEKTQTITVDLHQKSHDAQITVHVEDFKYSDVSQKELETIHDQSIFKLQLEHRQGDAEVMIRIPLKFEVKGQGKNEDGLHFRLTDLQLMEKETPETEKNKQGSRKAEKSEIFIVG
jgi:hypothetical protein